MTGYETLPCGCQCKQEIVGSENTFVMIPCSLTCTFYLYAVEETKRQGKRVVQIGGDAP